MKRILVETKTNLSANIDKSSQSLWLCGLHFAGATCALYYIPFHEITDSNGSLDSENIMLRIDFRYPPFIVAMLIFESFFLFSIQFVVVIAYGYIY